jgi:16S rRNA (guanine1207-N2)-methyltransferase
MENVIGGHYMKYPAVAGYVLLPYTARLTLMTKSMTRIDPALDTLFLPFAAGQLAWSDDALFLRARAGATVPKPAAGFVCQQSFKPDADALQRAGYRLVTEDQRDRYALVFVLPPRQRDEARAVFARAVHALKPGGRIVACASNDEGARSHEADMEKLVGAVNTLSKNKCRVFWSEPLAAIPNVELAAAWRELDAARPIADGRFVSRPGVFAWDRIDIASQLLAEHLPVDLTGYAADLGAGFGYLSAELLTRCPNVKALDAYEADARALDLARINLAQFANRVALQFHWHDVTAGLPRKYDVIVTNPPFHTQSRADRPDIGRRFIAVAAQSLNPGGRLWLVANRHLPYEETLDSNFGSVRIVTQAHGFKIVAAVKSSASSGKR